MISASLRVDVDTYRGTQEGVPRLLDLLDEAGVKASFFFSVGPDNMGRHLWRLIKPCFLWKMLRSQAVRLYGWDIVLAGTAWPGRLIGRHLGALMRETLARGHEVGLHAWDHYAWQTQIGHWDAQQVAQAFQRGLQTLEDILGQSVTCSAAPGWRIDSSVLQALQCPQFRYQSDCRGHSIFRPSLENGQFGVPQIPVDLPTFDEVASFNTSPASWNQYLLSRIQPDALNTYTIHAEVEGITMASGFRDFLHEAALKSIHFAPLGDRLPQNDALLPEGKLHRGAISGREGWVGIQA